MNNPRLQNYYFFLALFTGVLVLSFFVLKPFLYALILSMVFATILQPVYKRIKSLVKDREGLSSLITIFAVILFVFTPISFLGIQIYQEAQQIYLSFNEEGGGKGVILDVFSGPVESLNRYFPASQEVAIDVDKYVKQSLSWLIGHLSTVFSSLAKIMLSSFIFLISLFCLLKDGYKLKRFVVLLSPLSDTDDEAIIKKLELAVNSVIKGSLIIALIQGGLTATGLAIFGVPNAILWGTIATVTALIPGIGTSLVLIPAVAFLFLTNNSASGLGLLLWGMLAVGLVDNFLGPKLIGRNMRIHPFIVLLSVLGGLAFFGPIGFLLGPLTISLLFALFDIYLPQGSNKFI